MARFVEGRVWASSTSRARLKTEGRNAGRPLFLRFRMKRA